MKLTDIIEIWDQLHIKNTGDIGFSDLEKVIERVMGVENDISPEQPTLKTNVIAGRYEDGIDRGVT